MKSWMFAALLPFALSATPAGASTIFYTITGNYQASFTIDNPPPAVPDISDPEVFYVFDVTGTFGGHSGLGGITFYSDAADGGLTITFLNPDTNSYDIVNLAGAQLYSGTVDSPFLLTFAPTGFRDWDSGEPNVYLLSAAAVPEPASWALMIGGFGLVGAMARRRAPAGAVPALA